METDITRRLCVLLYSATGQSYDNDLRTLCDLTGGKLLLDWLSAQVSTSSTTESIAAEERVASLRDIILEEEEITMSNTIGSSVNNCMKSIVVAPRDYMLPSQSKKHADYIRNETQEILREANELRMKISQTKIERQRCKRTIKLLRSTVDSLASVVAESNEALSELSIGVDATITSIVKTAQGLLCALEHYASRSASATFKEKEIGESGQALLKMIQAHMFSITQNLQTYSTQYHELRKKELRRQQHLHYETERLSNSLKSAHISMMAQEIPDSGQTQVLSQELADISDILKSQLSGNIQFSPDQFAKSLTSIDEEIDPHPFGTAANSVEEKVACAWKMDQLTIMQCREEELYDASSSLNLGLSLLENMHNSILQVMRFTRDAEATLETLGEELAELDTEAGVGNKKQTHLEMDDALQQELKSILINCKETLLLDKEDILVQLRFLKSKVGKLEKSHRDWATNVISNCSLRPVHHLLPDIYSQSPLNSSPPFEFSANTRELENQTRTSMRQLHSLSKSLEKEVQDTFSKDDHLKRLKCFVDRWPSPMAGVP